MPVCLHFRGVYSNKNAFWEQRSSQAIILTNSASKWYEKAFITLTLQGLGYDPKAVSKTVRLGDIGILYNFLFIFYRMLWCVGKTF